MKLSTKKFGDIEVEDNKIIHFASGIIGFEDKKNFVIFSEEDDSPNSLFWIQCVDDGDLALPAIIPFAWYPTYSPDIADEYIESIGELVEEDLEIFNVVVIRSNIEDMTVNLKAPIVVNNKTMKGMQVIANDDDLEVRHNLYEQIKSLRMGE